MGERLDRVLQRRLLECLSDAYPNAMDLDSHEMFNSGSPDVVVNMHYLHEHGLVNVEFAQTFKGIELVDARITAQGLDFLANDGGLGAILGVLTVKLHDDTVRALLLARIEETNDADEPTKARLRDAVKDLPAHALKTITTKALEAGISRIPDFAHWIGQVIHMAG